MDTKLNPLSFWIWLYWVNPTQYTINTLTSKAFYCHVTTPLCDTCSLVPNSCPTCPCAHVTDEGNIHVTDEGNIHVTDEGNIHVTDEGNIHVTDEGRATCWPGLLCRTLCLDYNARFKHMGILAAFIFSFMVSTVLALRFMKYNVR